MLGLGCNFKWTASSSLRKSHSDEELKDVGETSCVDVYGADFQAGRMAKMLVGSEQSVQGVGGMDG